MSSDFESLSEQQASWDATREQSPKRAEWMAHAEKTDVESANKMNKIVKMLEHFQELPEDEIKTMESASAKRRSAGRKKANHAGRQFDLKIHNS